MCCTAYMRSAHTKLTTILRRGADQLHCYTEATAFLSTFRLDRIVQRDKIAACLVRQEYF